MRSLKYFNSVYLQLALESARLLQTERRHTQQCLQPGRFIQVWSHYVEIGVHQMLNPQLVYSEYQFVFFTFESDLVCTDVVAHSSEDVMQTKIHKSAIMVGQRRYILQRRLWTLSIDSVVCILYFETAISPLFPGIHLTYLTASAV